MWEFWRRKNAISDAIGCDLLCATNLRRCLRQFVVRNRSFGVIILTEVSLIIECRVLDCEGGFKAVRLKAMARYLVKYLKKKEARNESSFHSRPIYEKDVLERIYLQQVNSLDHLLRVINSLLASLKQRPNVKLIVVDSITFHFRILQIASTLQLW